MNLRPGENFLWAGKWLKNFLLGLAKFAVCRAKIEPQDIENIKSNLLKNAYPPFLIEKVIKKYLNHKFSSNKNQLKDTSDVYDFKLPYIGNLLHHIKNKISKLCKEFCKENFNVKLVFNSFKIKNYFSYKDIIPDDLKSFLVYQFTCASCSSGCRDLTSF